MTAPPAPPAILVIAPMPAFPTSAGNRRRLLATCQSLRRGGFAVDLAVYGHEDQIYRRFGQHPPSDAAATAEAFRHSFLVETRATIPLKTRSPFFGIDEWCPDEVGDFVAWYFDAYPDTGAIVVNYVFLSRCLERVPEGILKVIDTHDRFAGRQDQYRPFRAEPNFFYTDRANEAAGLARADLVLAIQSEEAAHFAGLTERPVHLLPPHFPPRRPFRAPEAIRRIGFIGHGNDPNLFSISKFVHAWAADWGPGLPELVVAGEICGSLGGFAAPGVRLDGYVAELETFYDGIDLVVAPMLMGSGLKMKVAEALAFGLPVIGTGIGFEGFDPVIAAHRCEGVEGVKAAVLALRDDPAGLAALTRACADLFARYNDLSRRAEDDLVALIRRRAPRPDHVPAAGDVAVAAEAPVSARRGAVTLTRERSLRSLVRDDPEHGILVATERLPDGAQEAARYTPLRRRWFARAEDPAAEPAGEATADGIGPGPTPVALSPEWVRERRLPAPGRAALALLFRDVRPDWETGGEVVGFADGRVELALPLPSFLLTGSRAAAAFLIDPAGRGAVELTLESVIPLRAALRIPFAAVTGRDLTPVPAAVGLRYAVARAPALAGRLLILTDDLIGRVVLPVAGEAPEARA